MIRMRMRMMRITMKSGMRTMDDKHNDNNSGDNNNTTIKRKQGSKTETQDKEKG